MDENTTTQTLAPLTGTTKPTLGLGWTKFFLCSAVSGTVFLAIFFVQGRLLQDDIVRSSFLRQLSQFATSTTDTTAQSSSLLQAGPYFLHLDSLNFRLKEVVNSLADRLSFSSDLPRQRAEATVRKLLTDALYFSELSDSSGADERVQKIRETASAYANDAEFQQFIIVYAKALAQFPASHPFAAVANDFEQMVLKNPALGGAGEDVVGLVLARGEKIIGALERSENTTANLVALTIWKSDLDSLSQKLDTKALTPIFDLFKPRLEALVTSRDALLTKDFLETVNGFEQSALKLSEEGARLAAQGALLGLNHAALVKVKALLATDAMRADDAKELIIVSLSKIRALETALSADDMHMLAFEADQKALQPFFAFLFSPEFEGLRGSYDQRYRDFLALEKEASDISALSGSKASTSKTSRISPLADVQKDFEAIGISAVLKMADGDNGWISVNNGKISGQSFSASYQPSRKIFTDIVLNGETISQSVTLEKFPSFVLALVGKLTVPQAHPVPSKGAPAETVDSKVEKVFKAKILEKLSVLGVLVKESQIISVDVKTGMANVDNANIAAPGAPSLPVSFDFYNDTNETANVKFDSVAGALLIKEKFPVSKLVERVNALINSAKVEAERVKRKPEEPVL